MMKINIHGFDGSNQVTMDKGFKMTFHCYIKELIRDKARHGREGYVLFAEELHIEDQAEFLSYLIDANAYDYYMRYPVLLKAACDIRLKQMQKYIDSYIDDVFHEDMEEMGFYLNRDGYSTDNVITKR